MNVQPSVAAPLLARDRIQHTLVVDVLNGGDQPDGAEEHVDPVVARAGRLGVGNATVGP